MLGGALTFDFVEKNKQKQKEELNAEVCVGDASGPQSR